MVQKKNTTLAAIIIAVVILVLSAFPLPVAQFGLCADAGIEARVSYHFFHASIIHAALNAWSIVAIAVKYSPPLKFLLIAFIIATLIPEALLQSTPIVGLSGVCFAMLGSCLVWSHAVFNSYLYVALFLAVGFLFPQVAAILHAYAFVSGAAVALLFVPICRRK